MVRQPSEAELARLAVAYLESCGHDVYEEVECIGGIADIVALAGRWREVWVVEAKRGVTLELIEQCISRKRVAARVFAAIPVQPGAKQRRHYWLLKHHGIGILELDPSIYRYHQAPSQGDMAGAVRLVAMAERVSRDRRHGAALRASLQPGHKTHARAGSVNGAGRWTPYRQTCEALAEVVRRQPGICLKDAIARIKHHYSSEASARSSIAHWLERGKVPGVRLEQPGAALHPTE